MPLEFRLVLVSPQHAGNVGAVARVASNFALSDVVVVSPQCQWRGPDALRFAKGPAKAMLESMREERDLPQALQGCAVAVGFTRRTGAARAPSIAAGDVAGLTRLGRAALVFGREDAGLTAEELALCTHICTFSTDEANPSLNLSHAVAVVAARLFEARAAVAGTATGHAHHDEVAPLEEVEALLGHWEQTLRDVGLTEGANPERLLIKIRHVLGRASVTRSEVGALRASLSKTQVALGTRVNQRRQPR